MKKLLLLSIFSICWFLCFCQYTTSEYIILPKSGNPIESIQCYRNNNSIEYLLRGEYMYIEIDDILLIYKDGKELNFNELTTKTDEENQKKQDSKKQPSNESKETPKQGEKTVTNTNVYQQTNNIFTVFEEIELVVINRGLGSATWAEAKSMCVELDRGGFRDWYLPSKNELIMILETKNKEFKDNLSSFWYWSSTEINDKNAYNVSKNAWATDEKKKNDGPDCLCVRKISQ